MTYLLARNVGPLVLVAFATALGACFGAWLIGLTVGLGIVLVATWMK